MGSEIFPRHIANLITEDPDEVKPPTPEADANAQGPDTEPQQNWSYGFEYGFDELELENSSDLYYGNMIIGAEYNEGDPGVMRDRDGSGYPPTDSSWDWEIIDISGVTAIGPDEQVDDPDQVVDVTPELKKQIIAALMAGTDDEEMQYRMSEDHEEPEEDYDDSLRPGDEDY